MERRCDSCKALRETASLEGCLVKAASAGNKGGPWGARISRALRATFLAVVLSGIASNVSAQKDYPNRPIRFLVGVVPGGATDILARVIGQKLGDTWNQQGVIDNPPGENQIIAAELTAKA